jgi:hypothetical protein
MNRIRNYFTGLYIRFRGRQGALKRAIKKADRLQRKTGKRYRVFFFGYRYHAWSRRDIRERKRTGIFHSHLKAGSDFDTICFYDTANPAVHVSEP